MTTPTETSRPDKDALAMFERFLEISFLASGCHADAIEYAALTRDIPEEIRRLKAFAAQADTRPKEKPEPEWPRIRDLPSSERDCFDAWLYGQTRPMLRGLPDSEQDGYFPWDYDRWKAGRPIIN